jgi:hypothetical protein
MYLKFNRFEKQILIFSFICLIAFINFGYSGLKFPIQMHKSLDHDAWVYLTMVQDGVMSVNDFRSSRVLSPFLGYIITLINNFFGFTNLPQLNLLIVNSIFFGLAVLVFGFYLQLLKQETFFIVSIFILTINFATVNYLAQSLVEAAEVFFYMLLLYTLKKKRYYFIPIIFLFGSLNKILFVVGGGSLLVYHQLNILIKNPSQITFFKFIFQNIITAILILVPFLIIKFQLYGGLETTFDVIDRHQQYVPNFNNAHGFLYVHILFLPIGLYGLWKKNRKLFYVCLSIMFPVLIFGVLIGADPVSWGRYIFSASCFPLSLGCAYVLFNWNSN